MNNKEAPTSAMYKAETGTQFSAKAELSYTIIWANSTTWPRDMIDASLADL